ncbi:MAG: hypothetical protein EXR72_02075 [Myxococcales bacterium]|nr:hypothetical protein [Myxococcales bacterium]
MAKTQCPLTKTEFMEKATAVKIDIGGVPMVAEAREFSTGSFGWYLTGKATLTVDGKPIQVQVGCNLAVVGSKEAAR